MVTQPGFTCITLSVATGPARAILQLWREADIFPQSEPDIYDYTLWVLDEKGHLTGDIFVSGTALEARTTRK